MDQERAQPPALSPGDIRKVGLPPVDIVDRIGVYLAHRAAYEGTEHILSPQFYAAIVARALCAFFGLELDDKHRLVADRRNPEAFAAWQAQHSTRRH